MKVQHYKADPDLPAGRWLIANLEVGYPWVKEIIPIKYKSFDLLALPAKDDLFPGIAICLDDGNKLVDRSALTSAKTTVGHFLSALCWQQNSEVNIVGFSQGPSRYSGRLQHIQEWKRHYFDEVPAVEEEKQLLALALYREAMGLNNAAFRFLSYYKILNIVFSDGDKQKRWINANLDGLREMAQKRITELAATEPDAGAYLYHSCRCAVAHSHIGKDGNVANPDDYSDYERLSSDTPLIKALAEKLIEEKLDIKTRYTTYKEHLYELKGFKRFLPGPIIEGIIDGTFTDTGGLIFPNMAIRLRGQNRFNLLENLKVKALNIADSGLVPKTVPYEFYFHFGTVSRSTS